MNILSIDVGMKHLAYCVIKTNSKEEYEILDWNIINDYGKTRVIIYRFIMLIQTFLCRFVIIRCNY